MGTTAAAFHPDHERRALGTIALVTAFARLRWRLLTRSLGARGGERLGATLSTAAALVAGTIGFTALAVAGRLVDDPLGLATTATVGITAAVVGLGIVTGVSRPIDPRVLATEPLSSHQRTVGLLVATAVGPAGLAAIAVGIGLIVGLQRGPTSLLVLVPAVAIWLLILLLAARTATELLGAVLRRAPRTGYALVGLAALGVYALVQLGPAVLARLSATERARLVDLVGWTPVGQLARAMTGAADSPFTATTHLVAGALAVPVLGAVHLAAARHAGTDAGGPTANRADRRPDARPSSWVGGRSFLDSLTGDGAAGAVARRRLWARFRRPRTALETAAAAGIGMAAVLAPLALRDEPGGGAVLVGGAIQLAVLLIAGNSFGNDGPAVIDDLLAGGPRLLVTGTVRATLVIAAPLALLGPPTAAGVTGAWHLLPAGWLVAGGALLAGAGGAMVQSVLVPIPIPEGDDPFAKGESGRTLVAALALVVVLGALALAMSPLLLALVWATSAGSTGTITALAAVSVVAGWAICRGGVALAIHRLERRTAEFVVALTPAR